MPPITTSTCRASIIAVLLVGWCFTSSAPAHGQNWISGFSRPAGAVDVSFSYTSETGDEFYVGGTERGLTDPPLPYSEISRRTYSVFVGFGVTDNLDVTLNLPYVSTSSNYTDGFPPPATNALPASQENVQDGAVKVSWRAGWTSIGPGTASVTVALRGSAPLSDYSNGANLVAFQTPNGQMKAPNLVVIGDRASALRGGGLAQYRFSSGVFTSLQAGYQFTGEASGLDVPNHLYIGGRLGYAASRFYGEAWVGRSSSTSGPDIGENPRFPLHEADYTRLGLDASVKVLSPLWLNAGAFTVVDGRNVLKTNGFTLGITLKPSTPLLQRLRP